MKLKMDGGSEHLKSVPQAKLFEHFCQEGHKGIEDWSFVLIDQARTKEHLVKKELFWQYQLRVFAPEGLNIRDAPAF